MKTSKNLTGDNTGEKWTLFQEDFPVNHSPQQVKEKARRTTATSGRKCSELYGKFSPLGSLVKTLLESSAWTMGVYTTKYKLTWKVKGTPYSRLIFQLAVQELHTGGNGSGLLPTPTTFYTRENWSREELAKKQAEVKARTNSRKDGVRSGNGFGLNLAQAINLLPTPAASPDGRKIKPDWEWRGTHFRDQTGKKIQSDVRFNIEKMEDENTGQNLGLKLQPEFVEWMMGYPEGWTEITA